MPADIPTFIPNTDLHICSECGNQLVVKMGEIGYIDGEKVPDGYVIPMHHKRVCGPLCSESGMPVDKAIRSCLST